MRVLDHVCLGLVIAVYAACSGGGSGSPSGASGTGGAATGTSGDAVSTSAGAGGSGGAALPGPDPACLVPDKDSATTYITVAPSPLTTADAPTMTVTETTTGFTNVALDLCTPAGPVQAMFGGVDSGNPPFAWHWTAPPLPFGQTQIVFRADPGGAVYRTLRVDVGKGDLDAGSDAAVDAGDVCASPAGNLIQNGTFEEGMDMLAPHLWQVRNPAMPDMCLGSGAPDQHVFLDNGPPACGGHALVIDARGQWDCYAVQRFSDYNTIEGGHTYRISASVRAAGNAINPAAWFVLGAQWLDASDAVFGDEKNPKPLMASDNDYDWKVLSWDVVAPVNARRIVVWLSAHYPGRVDYDNVAVVKIN